MECFECGDIAEHSHHVIPRSLGGTKTIPLCLVCHGRAHKRKKFSSSYLTKRAMAVKKSRGERTGQVPYGYQVSADGVHLEKDPEEQRAIELITSYRNKGDSLRKITEKMNASELKPRGNKWHMTTVVRILKA